MSITRPLDRAQLFTGLSQEELQKITSLSGRRTYQKGDTVLSEGEISRELFIVSKGTVEVSLKTDEASTPLLRLGAGQIFGEMTLVDRGARSATVTALEDPTVLQVIPHDALLQLCEDDNHIGFIVMRNLAAEMSLRLRYYNISLTMDAAT